MWRDSGPRRLRPTARAVQVTSIVSDAKFILLVEKDAAFMRLAEDRFYNTYPCIILTAKGQPDVATRLFLRKLRSALNIPVLALVDSDPYGLKILSAPPPPRVPRDALSAHNEQPDSPCCVLWLPSHVESPSADAP